MERNPILRVKILVRKTDGQHVFHTFDGFHRAAEAIRNNVIENDDRVLLVIVDDNCIYCRLMTDHDLTRNKLLTFFN